MNLTLLEGIALFAGIAAELEGEIQHALEHAGEVICEESKAEIGVYQGAAGPTAAWAPLAPSTVADREARGYEPDDPLERENELRESISYEVSGHEVSIGSDSDVAVYQELGTSKIPPRSFLVGAAYRKESEVVKDIGGGVFLKILK
jgi:hypothetical protein